MLRFRLIETPFSPVYHSIGPDVCLLYPFGSEVRGWDSRIVSPESAVAVQEQQQFSSKYQTQRPAVSLSGLSQVLLLG
jgi:hypothetical protein